MLCEGRKQRLRQSCKLSSWVLKACPNVNTNQLDILEIKSYNKGNSLEELNIIFEQEEELIIKFEDRSFKMIQSKLIDKKKKKKKMNQSLRYLWGINKHTNICI